MKTGYEQLTKINESNFKDKRVLVIGAGWMGEQHCKALFAMKIKDVTVISRREESARRCCKEYGYKPLHGGYENNLSKLGIFDLVIIAIPIHELRDAASFAASCGNKNILVEKPGALYSTVLKNWADEIKNADIRIRIAYNRHTYPSLWKLKEFITDKGQITSCTYMLTEWIHTINFSNNQPEVYERWGIANSLHVISMVHHLIGMPKEMSSYRSGGYSWHPTGTIFVGSGVTETEVLFSYQADWGSAGRWGIEIMTDHGAYRLIPLEKLFYCPKGSLEWTQIQLVSAYPQAKDGIAEEIAVMLNRELEKDIPLVTLEYAAILTELAENIFGYPSSPSTL